MTSTETLAFNLHPELITVVPLVFLCLTALAVSLRLYVRGYMLRAFGLDDWILLFAWVSDAFHLRDPPVLETPATY